MGHLVFRRRVSSRRLAEGGGDFEVASEPDAGAQAGASTLHSTFFETLATMVLAVAAVATAWSAYQSSRWNGIMATEFNEAGALRAESVRASTAAGQRQVVDVTLVADWLYATISGDDAVARELRARMPPELDVAMTAWLGDWQTEQPLPEGHPFSEGRYQAPGVAEAQELERRAEATFKQGRDANQRSDNYVLTGVLFALTLFFAAMTGKFGTVNHARGMVTASVCLMVIGVVLLIIQPKNVGV